jgi:hypothetical protein
MHQLSENIQQAVSRPVYPVLNPELTGSTQLSNPQSAVRDYFFHTLSTPPGQVALREK